ncbi:MAG: type IV secretory system conjugative DNA transfer family protein [Oscillospiraceae bacterium]|nr:type IV secretory system conjugative DNA transfer family protein [Oscillospiraceae bacterium]
MKRRILPAVIAFGAVCLAACLYLAGLLSQVRSAAGAGVLTGEETPAVSFSPFICLREAVTPAGAGIFVMILLALCLAAGYFLRRRREKIKGAGRFTPAGTGVYGTAGWMSEAERRQVLNLSFVSDTDEMILGTRPGDGRVYCLPGDTPLNRHAAVIGASGTMKSRAVIRNALFQIIRRNESVVVTDPKGELYADTAKLYRDAGYTVRVFDLVSPRNSDGWNCMDDVLAGDPLAAQILTGVIIRNTGTGRSDPFWDNGEANLLKALVLYVANEPNLDRARKNLGTVYMALVRSSVTSLQSLFSGLPKNHPALPSWNLFAKSAKNVQANYVTGLGTRLQVLQERGARYLVSSSDIDLSAPGREKCAYFVILSDQDATMAFLSSLFFTFLFIDLVRTADASPEGRCRVPVNLILDEFNNIGRIGASEDGSDFARALSTVRSRDIRVMLAVQSLSQLQNRYGNGLWAEIIGNCDIQLLLGTTDADVTAKYFSERSGSLGGETTSVSRQKRSGPLGGSFPGYRESSSGTSRRLLMPDEILRLDPEDLLIFIRGRNVLKAEKFDYTKHPMSKKIVRENVADYVPVRARSAAAGNAAQAPTEEKTVERAELKKAPREIDGGRI